MIDNRRIKLRRIMAPRTELRLSTYRTCYRTPPSSQWCSRLRAISDMPNGCCAISSFSRSRKSRARADWKVSFLALARNTRPRAGTDDADLLPYRGTLIQGIEDTRAKDQDLRKTRQEVVELLRRYNDFVSCFHRDDDTLPL